MVEERYNFKSYCFFSLKSLEVLKKQKLLNEEGYMLFINSTSINMNPDINKNQDDQKHSIERSKNGRGITKFHLCCTFSCPIIFRLLPGNSHNAPEGRELIESIYPQNNNYLLIDRLTKMIKL